MALAKLKPSIARVSANPLELYPTIKPVAGMVIEAYLSRNDLSGLRVFIITQVGHKFVHLFYGPQLLAIKLSHAEFRTLLMRPVLDLNAKGMKARIKDKADQCERFNLQYSAALVHKVMRLKLVSSVDMFGHKARNVGKVTT